MSYTNVEDAVHSIFCQLFISAWPESMDYYYQNLAPSDPRLKELPYIAPLFIGITYFFCLIFQDLFIPQLFSNTTISRILSEDVCYRQ